MQFGQEGFLSSVTGTQVEHLEHTIAYVWGTKLVLFGVGRLMGIPDILDDSEAINQHLLTDMWAQQIHRNGRFFWLLQKAVDKETEYTNITCTRDTDTDTRI